LTPEISIYRPSRRPPRREPILLPHEEGEEGKEVDEREGEEETAVEDLRAPRNQWHETSFLILRMRVPAFHLGCA
jgi:hypothetical protein